MTALLAAAAALGFLGVLLGAFGAHLMRSRLSLDRMANWTTAVQYQFIHALAMGGVVVAEPHLTRFWAEWAGWLFFAGVLLFSGTLYGLAATGYKRLGALTPLGGLLLLAGWAFLFLGALR